MLRKRKEQKSIAMTLMRDLQGSAADKLAMFERVRAAGGFAKEDLPISRRRRRCCVRLWRWRKGVGNGGER
jgi:hypothetical protein